MEPDTPAIRLVALDLDGTILGADLQISEMVKVAVAKAQAQGVFVTLATGRAFRSALPFAEELALRTPLICYQGGLIQHPLTGEVLQRALMPRALLADVVRLADAHDLDLTIFQGDEVYARRFRQPRAFYDRYFGLPLRQVDDLMAALPGDPIKFIVIAEPERADVHGRGRDLT